MAERGLKPYEAQAQAAILDLVQLRGWAAYHTHDSRRSQPGFPDLVLAKRRIVYAELKRPGEKPRSDQVGWLNQLAAAGGEVYLWTLDDLDEISRILAGAWEFVAHGRAATPFAAVDGPGLVTAGSGGQHFAPRSAWIPGHGRRDA